MQRPHETLKKLVVVIAIALSSNANAETFEQWVKNAGVHADKAMSPDQLRQFLTDYHASQGRNFDPNVIALDATAAAVQINMAILKDQKPDDHKCDTHENGTVTVCSDLWLFKDGKMWKTTSTAPKGNRVSYCNARYGPAGTKNVAACGYYDIEAGGNEKPTGYSVLIDQVELSWRARAKRPPFMEDGNCQHLNNGRNVCSVNGGQLVEPSWCSDPAQGNWRCDTTRNTRPFVEDRHQEQNKSDDEFLKDMYQKRAQEEREEEQREKARREALITEEWQLKEQAMKTALGKCGLRSEVEAKGNTCMIKLLKGCINDGDRTLWKEVLNCVSAQSVQGVAPRR